MSEFDFNSIISNSVLESKSVKELRGICIELGIPRYSKASKPNLIKMINDFYSEQLLEMTAKDLRKLCTDNGITGVAKTTKPNLINLLLSHVEPVMAEAETEIIGDVIDISSDCDEQPIESSPDMTGSITVVNGARSRIIPFEKDKTVWDIHQQMANEMGIAAHPNFTINESDAPNNVIIREGDTIEFFKVSGTKG